MKVIQLSFWDTDTDVGSLNRQYVWIELCMTTCTSPWSNRLSYVPVKEFAKYLFLRNRSRYKMCLFRLIWWKPDNIKSINQIRELEWSNLSRRPEDGYQYHKFVNLTTEIVLSRLSLPCLLQITARNESCMYTCFTFLVKNVFVL